MRFFKDEEFLHSFEYYDPGRGVSLNGKSRIITLELSKLEGIVEKPIDEMSSQELWAVFFQYLPDTSKRQKINEIIDREEGIAMASKVLKSISKDEIERARLMSEYKYQLDLQSQLVTAERKGKEEGIKKGIKEGRQKGKEEGRLEGQDYVLELMAQGLSYEEIRKKIEENKKG